jgi:hypothetical protein
MYWTKKQWLVVKRSRNASIRTIAAKDGTPIQDCLAMGGQLGVPSRKTRDRCGYRCFYWTHGEQGVLEVPVEYKISRCEGVVGQYRFMVQIVVQCLCRTNSASMRKDAILWRLQLVLAINRLGMLYHGEQVATVDILRFPPTRLML